MQLHRVVMVIVDISGYTRFLKHRVISLLHAEQIITDLLGVVLEKAQFPLKLNKLEGDAAFLYAQIPGVVEPREVLKDVLRQVESFFEAFAHRRLEMSTDVLICPCDACQHLLKLRLKAVIHSGEVVIKQVRQFEELAGEEVILIHRLLKNSLGAEEYVLMPEAIAGEPMNLWKDGSIRRFVEEYDEIGQVPLLAWIPPDQLCPPENRSRAEVWKARLRMEARWTLRMLLKLPRLLRRVFRRPGQG